MKKCTYSTKQELIFYLFQMSTNPPFSTSDNLMLSVSVITHKELYFSYNTLQLHTSVDVLCRQLRESSLTQPSRNILKRYICTCIYFIYFQYMYMECCQVAIYLTHSQQNFKKVQFRTDLLYASMGKIKNQN